jgi:hypothetical protein
MAAKLTAFLQMLTSPQAGAAFLLSTLTQRRAGLDTGPSTNPPSRKYPHTLLLLVEAAHPKEAAARVAF